MAELSETERRRAHELHTHSGQRCPWWRYADRPAAPAVCGTCQPPLPELAVVDAPAAAGGVLTYRGELAGEHSGWVWVVWRCGCSPAHPTLVLALACAQAELRRRARLRRRVERQVFDRHAEVPRQAGQVAGRRPVVAELPRSQRGSVHAHAAGDFLGREGERVAGLELGPDGADAVHDRARVRRPGAPAGTLAGRRRA